MRNERTSLLSINRNTLFIAVALTALSVVLVEGELSPECLQETQDLQNDSFLDLVQNDLYDQYQDDYNSVCEFGGLTSLPDCGFEFDGNNKTYVAACEDKGGQVLTRPVILKCGYSYASVDLGLGAVPTCIGKSCNATDIKASDDYTDQLMDSRVEEFFNNLSFTGCSADYSSATTHSTTKRSISVLLMGLLTAAAATTSTVWI